MPGAGVKAVIEELPDQGTDAAAEAHFLRHGLTGNGLFESICFRCGTTVGRSPDQSALQAAEERHACFPAPRRRLQNGSR